MRPACLWSAEDLVRRSGGDNVGRPGCLALLLEEAAGPVHLERAAEHRVVRGGRVASLLTAGLRPGQEQPVTGVRPICHALRPYRPHRHSAAALDQIAVPHPGGFTDEFTFRRCPGCGERNLVRDGEFACAICDAELPAAWNFGSAGQRGQLAAASELAGEPSALAAASLATIRVCSHGLRLRFMER